MINLKSDNTMFYILFWCFVIRSELWNEVCGIDVYYLVYHNHIYVYLDVLAYIKQAITSVIVGKFLQNPLEGRTRLVSRAMLRLDISAVLSVDYSCVRINPCDEDQTALLLCHFWFLWRHKMRKMRGEVGKKTPKKRNGEYDVKSDAKEMQFGLRQSVFVICSKFQYSDQVDQEYTKFKMY